MTDPWRPYTDPAPDGTPLWLKTQEGGVYRGAWSADSGFKAADMPPGVQVIGWSARRDGEIPSEAMEAPLDLAALRRQPIPEVVAALEDMTRRAKAGKVRGFAMALEYAGGCTGAVFEIGDADIARMYTALARLQARLLAAVE